MTHRVTVLPRNVELEARRGETLLCALTRAGLVTDAPCGGEGKCGKCRVNANGREVLACRTTVDGDMTVTLADEEPQQILAAGREHGAAGTGYALAFDIGTTTVVGYLMGDGSTLAAAGAGNPQTAWGADVISRIRHGIQGQLEPQTAAIRACLDALTQRLCRDAGQIGTVSVVGNPAMRQILLGMPLENLARIPFAPALTRAEIREAGEVLPRWAGARLVLAPDMAGFLGADTVAGILAAGMDQAEEMTLLVDIGTNGEMVLGSKHRMTACSAAAGPALEGAGIRFGMRGQRGAIDHVRFENGQLTCSVIGGGEARGICGSGLIDAAAAALEAGWLNSRGRILTEDGRIRLTEDIYLTQEDIRQVQLAKGAIAAGIHLMAGHLGIGLEEIDRVYLAGAFGTYMDAGSACRIGLLPPVLRDRITALGNAAGSGAKMLAWDPGVLERSQAIVNRTEALELSTLPGFARCFAKNMRF